MASSTILFVPGAWHGPAAFNETAKHLEAAGYKYAAVNLASVGAQPPLQNFDRDVTVIREAIQEQLDAGQNVIVVAHSYGSIPTCDALKGLDQASRQSRNAVIHKSSCAVS